MKIIGLSGKAGVGKTTVGELVRLDRSEDATRLSFGDSVKWEVSEELGFPLSWCYHQKGNAVESPIGMLTVREALQWWGTEIRRKENPNYWNMKMIERIGQSMDSGVELIIIDDVRFIDEAELVQNMKGKVFRLEPFPSWMNIAGSHRSETELDNYPGFEMIIEQEEGQPEWAAGLIINNVFRKEGR